MSDERLTSEPRPTRVAKRFRFDAAHRLVWHKGACRNLHGHSYGLIVEIEGIPDEKGMVIDFKHLKHAVKPLIQAWDHATLIAANDDVLRHAMLQIESKVFVLPYDTTAENMCRFVADYLLEQHRELLDDVSAGRLRIRIDETETSFAELIVPLQVMTTEKRPTLRLAPIHYATGWRHAASHQYR
jgi:6-pyruvoyltetrahydropterin/6-carboxytetrahydropterin synthase